MSDIGYEYVVFGTIFSFVYILPKSTTLSITISPYLKYNNESVLYLNAVGFEQKPSRLIIKVMVKVHVRESWVKKILKSGVCTENCSPWLKPWKSRP